MAVLCDLEDDDCPSHETQLRATDGLGSDTDHLRIDDESSRSPFLPSNALAAALTCYPYASAMVTLAHTDLRMIVSLSP